MNTWVIDASAAGELLLGTARGASVRSLVAESHLVGPQLLVPEVLSIIRGWVLGGHITADRGKRALMDFRALGVELLGMETLVTPAWELRHNLTSYDAMYVCLARALRVQVLSYDERMAKAAPHDVVLPSPSEVL